MAVSGVEVTKDWRDVDPLLPNPYLAIEFTSLDEDGDVTTNIYVNGLTPAHYDALIQFLPYLAVQFERAELAD